ncbi:MAG: carboxypeptidase M32 [Anaerolineales bacterium]|nr:carboxypeptidase M32 [Anaerolineales bacterium]
MNIEKKLNRLKQLLGRVADLHHASALLGWDQQTYMPRGGAQARGFQLGTLNSLAHEQFTSSEVGELLEELESYGEELDPDSNTARLLQVTEREYKKSTRVPASFVEEFSRVTSNAHGAWEEARKNDDFSHFEPHLQKIVEMRREYADFFAPYDHVYDPLLDDFEPGMKTASVQKIFDQLRPVQVELIQQINEQEQVDDSFLHQEFPGDKQWDFGEEVITSYGYDWDRGRQDKAAHPFTTNFSINDVRITTRVDPHFLNTALFGTLHEGGHALYEQGISLDLERTPLAGGTSLAVHESQSRMYENLVGRSYPFWEHFYPRLQEFFPSQLGNVSLDDFYQGINKVEPSLIRVEADEATYNLHIMLRMELEIALMEKQLEVSDLPEAWDQRMEDYLGITPPNDADGVLQDVHWSAGILGYFPTYSLGNLVSAQLWEVIQQDIPQVSDQIRSGEFGELLSWLRENVHQHGSKFKPQELVERVTGSRITPEPYIEYLTGKFGGIYEL